MGMGWGDQTTHYWKEDGDQTDHWAGVRVNVNGSEVQDGDHADLWEAWGIYMVGYYLRLLSKKKVLSA